MINVQQSTERVPCDVYAGVSQNADKTPRPLSPVPDAPKPAANPSK